MAATKAALALAKVEATAGARVIAAVSAIMANSKHESKAVIAKSGWNSMFDEYFQKLGRCCPPRHSLDSSHLFASLKLFLVVLFSIGFEPHK